MTLSVPGARIQSVLELEFRASLPLKPVEENTFQPLPTTGGWAVIRWLAAAADSNLPLH